MLRQYPICPKTIDFSPPCPPIFMCMALAEVQGWFAENDVEYVRAYPSALIGEDPEDLFARAADDGGSRAGWRSSDGFGLLGKKVACSLRSAGA